GAWGGASANFLSVEPDKEECIRARKDKITASPRLRFSLHQRRRGSSAIGAPTSFLVAPATVGSLIRQQTFAGSQGRRHHTDRRQGLRPGEPPEGKLDRSKGDKGGEGFGEVLEILDKPPVAPEPREGARPPSVAAGRRNPLCCRSV